MQQKPIEQQLAEARREITRLTEQNDLLVHMIKRAAREMKAGGKDLLTDLERTLKE